MGKVPRKAVATRDARFREAAWAYVAYGVVYWLGALLLVGAGVGPRGMTGAAGVEWSLATGLLFLVAALLIVVIPWLLVRERRWFARWVLARRDFARLLTLVVALRAFEVGRIARAPRVDVLSVLGFAVPTRLGAWVFFLVTVVMVVMLVRAAWAREP